METFPEPIPAVEPEFGVRKAPSHAEAAELRRADRLLQESEERMRFALSAAHAGVWEWHFASNRITWSGEEDAIYGVTHAARDYTWWSHIVDPYDLKLVEEQFRKAISTDGNYHAQFRITRADGEKRWIEARGRVFRNAEGTPTHLIGVHIDITEHKQIEEARYRELAGSLQQQVEIRTGELAKSTGEIQKMHDGLRALSARLMEVQDAERRRIARDLHDSAGQMLAALSIELSTLGEELRRTAPKFTGRMKQTEELLQDLQRAIRTTSYLLHPPLLDEAGLYSALSWYVDGLNERSSVQTTLEIAPDFGRLPRDLEIVVFRLVQESLTNIHKHSGSKTALIRIMKDAETLMVFVQDHGKGIPADKLARVQSQGSGVGIRGMRERLRQFNGELSVQSGVDGTQVTASIPIDFADERCTL
jgi:PAS domain S-box-containing protein